MAAVLIGFLLFELYPGSAKLVSPGPHAVDLWLASHPQTATIIQMPLLSALSGPQMLYTRYHAQRLASGYGTYFTVTFKQMYP
jgi:hypothetical protein